MCKQPLVSIVIPCYNAARYISEAIQSALSQTYPNCEVIVVDDGSSDNSLEIIKSFGDKIVWRTDPNGGASLARNRGLEIARGEWIQFLDSDDRLLPECVRSKVEEPKSPAEIICSSITLMDGYADQELTYFWKFPAYDHAAMLKHGTPQTACPLHRREDIAAIGGFDTELRIGEEYDLHLRLAFDLKRKFRVIKTPGVAIRARSDSLSRGTERREMGKRHVTDVLLKLYERHQAEFSPADREAFAIQAAQTARMLLRRGNPQAALKWIGICESLDKSGMRLAYRSGLVAAVAKSMGYDRFERLHSATMKLINRN